ncbi:unnamed protein product [Spodoptera exigua]|nr:unnamed protein product [Spodoptera exigua]
MSRRRSWTPATPPFVNPGRIAGLLEYGLGFQIFWDWGGIGVKGFGFRSRRNYPFVPKLDSSTIFYFRLYLAWLYLSDDGKALSAAVRKLEPKRFVRACNTLFVLIVGGKSVRLATSFRSFGVRLYKRIIVDEPLGNLKWCI